MAVLLLPSVLLLLLGPAFAIQRQGVRPFYRNLARPSSSWASFRAPFGAPPRDGLLRPQRSATRKITECLFATSEEGFYYYEAEENSEAVCGVYLFAGPDEIIQVRFEHLDVACESGGVVTFFDGWELKGKYFPGVDDHEKLFDERYTEFCGSEKVQEIFVTSQNAGMLHHRIPVKGGGFAFHVKFLKNPTPCNILVERMEEFYTLRNYGKAGNCTLIAVFPAKITVLALGVGVATPSGETGAIFQCQGRSSDELEIGGSEDLDTSRLVVFESVCGLDSSPGSVTVVARCEVSVVRLTSTGQFDNSATFGISQPDDDELLRSAYIC